MGSGVLGMGSGVLGKWARGFWASSEVLSKLGVFGPAGYASGGDTVLGKGVGQADGGAHHAR